MNPKKEIKYCPRGKHAWEIENIAHTQRGKNYKYTLLHKYYLMNFPYNYEKEKCPHKKCKTIKKEKIIL